VRTRFTLKVVVLAIIALGVLVAGPAVANAKGSGKKTLKLTAEEVQSEFLDLGTPGPIPSLGDELIFSETLFKRGREVGVSAVDCTVKQSVPPYDVAIFHCVATLKLFKKGQITLQGLIEVQGEDDPGPFKVAITGGTGKFRCACGEAIVRQTSEPGVEPVTSVYKLRIDSCKKGKKDDDKKGKKDRDRDRDRD
jgi:Allene oxide cyclase barrel like domain